MTVISIPSPASASVARDNRRRAHVALLQDVFNRSLLGLRGLSLARLAWTLGLVVVFALWSTMGNAIAGKRPDFCQDGLVRCFETWIPYYSVIFLPQMLALTLADNLPLRGAWRVMALIAGAILAGCAFLLLACTVVPLPDTGPDCREYPSLAAFEDMAFQVVFSAYWGGVIAVAYFARRRDRELAAALHASQLARIGARRKTLEAELHVMQARVEPTFLFDALRGTAALYESDHRAGDRLLDQLIQYLRAALPDMRASGSTVGREAELLRAYLNVLAYEPSGGLTVSTYVDRGLADAAMPPMMLVPLVAPVSDPRLRSRLRDASIRIDIRGIDGRARIALTATGSIAHAIAESPAVAEVRARLDALYGARASLAVDARSQDSAQLILEMSL